MRTIDWLKYQVPIYYMKKLEYCLRREDDNGDNCQPDEGIEQ